MILYALCRRRRLKTRKQRRLWTRPIYSQRKQRGCYSTLVQEMHLGDPQLHFRYFRMSKETFGNLLRRVSRAWIQYFSSPSIIPSQNLTSHAYTPAEKQNT